MRFTMLTLKFFRSIFISAEQKRAEALEAFIKKYEIIFSTAIIKPYNAGYGHRGMTIFIDSENITPERDSDIREDLNNVSQHFDLENFNLYAPNYCRVVYLEAHFLGKKNAKAEIAIHWNERDETRPILVHLGREIQKLKEKYQHGVVQELGALNIPKEISGIVEEYCSLR